MWPFKKKTPNADRRCFRGMCGPVEIVADPLGSWAALVSSDLCDLDADLRRFESSQSSEDEDERRHAWDSFRRLVAGVRQAFKIPTLAENGASDEEVFEFLGSFIRYLDDRKKKVSA